MRDLIEETWTIVAITFIGVSLAEAGAEMFRAPVVVMLFLVIFGLGCLEEGSKSSD